MRKFKTHSGAVVDLDDVKTYKYIKENTIAKLDSILFYDIGLLNILVNYKYPERFNYFTDFDSKQRLDSIHKNVAKLYDKNCKNKKWLKEQIFMLHDLSHRIVNNRKSKKK